MSNKWPLDWQDENDYRRLYKNKSKEIFAWEFLRRNKQYQEDFEINKELIKEKKFYFVKRILKDPINNSALWWEEDMRTWYGLGCESANYDYRIDTPPTFQDKGVFDPIASYEESEIPSNKKIIYFSELPIKQHDVLDFQLSTDFEFKPQIERIKEKFDSHRDESKVSLPNDYYYPLYLRTLDALDSGLTDEQILNSCIYKSHLETTKKDVNRYIKIAEGLRNGGYIRIVDSIIDKPRPEIDFYDPITFEIKLKS